MPRSTFGNVTRIAKNRYRLRWWEEERGEYRRRSRTVRGTRREAERALAEIRAGLDENTRHKKRAVPTIEEAYEKWVLPELDARVAESGLAKSTYDNLVSKWRKYVRPRWGKTKAGAIEPLEVQEWLGTMTKKPASDSLSLLRRILDKCELYDVVDGNVADRKYLMPKEQRDVADGAYTMRELDEIAQAAEGSPCEAAMLLSMFGSARTGESLGVRLDEVSRAESHGVRLTLAEINRQVRPDRTVSSEGELKNRQSVRTIVVPEPWGDRLWQLAEHARDAGEEWLCDDGTGRPMGQESLRREWVKACERAGVDVKQPRAARRSWETYMRWEMEVDRSKIEQMMGHALPGVTGEHYDKPTTRMFCDAVGKAFSCKPFVR